MLISFQSNDGYMAVPSSKITTEVFNQIIQLYNLPKSKEGKPYYQTPDPDPTMIHAKMYAAGDKYDIARLQEIAMTSLKECLDGREVEADPEGLAIQYLMANTPSSDRSVRKFIAKQIYQDMDWFGIRPCVREILHDFPELNDYCIRYQFKDDEHENGKED